MRTKQVIKTEIESDINYMFFIKSIDRLLKDNEEIPIIGIYYNEGKIYILYHERNYSKGFGDRRGSTDFYILNGLVSMVNYYSKNLEFELKNSDYLLGITPEEKAKAKEEAQKIREGIILYEPESELPLSSLSYDKRAVKLSKEEIEEINNFVHLSSLYEETLAVHLSVTYQEKEPIIHLSIVLSDDSNKVLNEIIRRYQQSSKRINFEMLIASKNTQELEDRKLLTLYDKIGILTLTCAEKVEEDKVAIPITNVNELYGTIPLHYKILHK